MHVFHLFKNYIAKQMERKEEERRERKNETLFYLNDNLRYKLMISLANKAGHARW